MLMKGDEAIGSQSPSHGVHRFVCRAPHTRPCTVHRSSPEHAVWHGAPLTSRAAPCDRVCAGQAHGAPAAVISAKFMKASHAALGYAGTCHPGQTLMLVPSSADRMP